MLDHCLARIALSWNDIVSSAHCIAFAGERERDRKKRNFAPTTQSILFQNSSFSKMKQVESDTGENMGRPRSDGHQFTK